MESTPFIISCLKNLTGEIPGVCIRYKYHSDALIHAVEISDPHSFHYEMIEQAETDLLFEFIERFPDENLGFVREGSELGFSEADWSNA